VKRAYDKSLGSFATETDVETTHYVIFSYRYLAAHESTQITASFLPGLIWVLKCLIRGPISLRVHL
jgi:hypothetical protein